MAEQTGVTMVGFEEALEAARQLSPRMERWVIGQATLRPARQLIKLQKSFAPPGSVLQQSIKQKGRRYGSTAFTRFVGPTWPLGAAINFVEWGTGRSREGAPILSPHWKGYKPRSIVRRAWALFRLAAERLIYAETRRLVDDQLEKLGRIHIPPAVRRRADF